MRLFGICEGCFKVTSPKFQEILLKFLVNPPFEKAIKQLLNLHNSQPTPWSKTGNLFLDRSITIAWFLCFLRLNTRSITKEVFWEYKMTDLSSVFVEFF